MTSRNTRAQQLKQSHWSEIERAYLSGVPYTKIAEQLKVSPITVAKWLREEGLRHKGTRGRYPSAMHGKVRQLLKKGWTAEELSERLNVPEDRIEQWGATEVEKAKKRRVKNPAPRNSQLSRRAQNFIADPPGPRHKPRTPWTKKEKRFVISMIRTGLTVLEVYRITGASKARQSKIWREAGNAGPPPNFPSREGAAKASKKVSARRRSAGRKGEVKALRQELSRAQKALAAERAERRSLALSRRRAAAEEPEAIPGQVDIVESPAELERAARASTGLPPSRQSALPRPKGEG